MPKEYKYLPTGIANYFLWRAREEGVQDMTPMKVIKLVYIAFAWYYTLVNKELFDEKIQAWEHGPVIPSLYHEFKRYKNKPVDRYAMEYSFDDNKERFPFVDKDDPETISVLNGVWEYYRNKSAIQLRKITHADASPWAKAYVPGKNNPIDDFKILKKRAQEAIEKYVVMKERHAEATT